MFSYFINKIRAYFEKKRDKREFERFSKQQKLMNRLRYHAALARVSHQIREEKHK